MLATHKEPYTHLGKKALENIRGEQTLLARKARQGRESPTGVLTQKQQLW
jgi:hypothetical protein